jgi:hypothetical protein
MPQLEVLNNPLRGSAGDMADHWTAADGDIVSRTSEEDTAGIIPGLMVAEGSTDADTCLLLAANTDVLCGIATRAHFVNQIDVTVTIDGDPFVYKAAGPGETLGIGRTGRYLVIIEENVAKGDQVHVRAVAAAGELAGAFRQQDDGTDTINCSDFCKWIRGGEVDADSGLGVAVLEVNMGLAPLATADS